jgi:hypothetical protein
MSPACPWHSRRHQMSLGGHGSESLTPIMTVDVSCATTSLLDDVVGDVLRSGERNKSDSGHCLAGASEHRIAADFCGRITSLPDAWQVHASEKIMWFVGDNEAPADHKDTCGFLNTRRDCDKIWCCISGSVKEERQPRRALTLLPRLPAGRRVSGRFFADPN